MDCHVLRGMRAVSDSIAGGDRLFGSGEIPLPCCSGYSRHGLSHLCHEENPDQDFTGRLDCWRLVSVRDGDAVARCRISCGGLCREGYHDAAALRLFQNPVFFIETEMGGNCLIACYICHCRGIYGIFAANLRSKPALSLSRDRLVPQPRTLFRISRYRCGSGMRLKKKSYRQPTTTDPQPIFQLSF